MELQHLREQFAGLDTGMAFFDNAGGSQILRSVVRRIGEYYEDCNVQHGATYATSQLAVERVTEARSGMATWVNAADATEIVLGPSTSQLARILAQSLGQTLGAGDEVIVTNCDHEANIGPWRELAERGVVVKEWPIHRESFSLRLEELEPLMTDRTRLVAWTHVSNVLGRIHPVRAFADFVRERGALSCVDGVAYAPHRAVDVQALGVDFYFVSLYKVFGPHLALLYGRRELLLDLSPVNHFFIQKEDLPYKFQPGGPNYELNAGLRGLWDYVDWAAKALGLAGPPRAKLDGLFDFITEREANLTEPLLECLRAAPNVRILGSSGTDPAERVCTVSFVVEGRRSDEIVEATDRAQLGVRYGDFYAHRLIENLGLRAQNGVVRASLLHYNTEEEVDRLVRVLDQALGTP